MKTLSTITMADFISVIADGRNDLMLENEESQAPESIATARMHLYEQFQSISDEVGLKVSLRRKADVIMNQMRALMFKICKNLLAIGAYDEVRTILVEYGYNNAKDKTDEEIDREIQSLIFRHDREVEMDRKDSEDSQTEETLTPDDIHSMFDSQTAGLMSHFKFQIDVNTMSAAQYAYLVAQAQREIKAIKALQQKK